MIKNIALFTLLFSFGTILHAERVADSEADEDKFGNKHDWCAEVNYGHSMIIVDTTEKFNENQFELLQNQILNNESIAKLPPYDRISILDLTGRNVTATQTKPIFSKCRPRNGQKSSQHNLDHPSFWAPKEKMQQKSNFFNAGLAEARSHFSELDDLSGDYSMIMELIKEISRVDELKFTDGSGYQNRKLIIFSDLIQNSMNLSIWTSCKKGKCITWDSVKDKPKIKQLMPSFDDGNKPEVFIYYLQCMYNRNLDNGMIEFWDGYFKDAGLEWDYDTETACLDPKNPKK